MILSSDPELFSPRRLNALLLCACFSLPLGGAYAQDGVPDLAEDEPVVGAPEPGMWNANSDKAATITGDVRITKSRITFANGSSISIKPAYPGARNVFKVDPAADPVMLYDNRLCGSPVTYVTILTYYAFALAMHMYDGVQQPPEPTPANVHEIARIGKCASYYYRHQIS